MILIVLAEVRREPCCEKTLDWEAFELFLDGLRLCFPSDFLVAQFVEKLRSDAENFLLLLQIRLEGLRLLGLLREVIFEVFYFPFEFE